MQEAANYLTTIFPNQIQNYSYKTLDQKIVLDIRRKPVSWTTSNPEDKSGTGPSVISIHAFNIFTVFDLTLYVQSDWQRASQIVRSCEELFPSMPSRSGDDELWMRAFDTQTLIKNVYSAVMNCSTPSSGPAFSFLFHCVHCAEWLKDEKQRLDSPKGHLR